MLNLIATLLIAQTPPAVTISMADGHFVLQNGTKTEVVPLVPESKPVTSVRYRRDENYAVWDTRGLVTRGGEWVLATRLKEIATTPKLFTREQILETQELAKAGKRQIESHALSGAVRLGNICYFLVRYTEGRGEAWLEALVAVELTDPHPKAKLIGRFEGLSMAGGWLDEKMFLLDKKLAVVTRKEDGWGLATYDTIESRFGFTPVGSDLKAIGTLGGGQFVFVEGTEYGPTRMGTWDSGSNERRALFETHGFLRLLDNSTPLISVIGQSQKMLLRNVEAGSQMEIPAGSGTARTPMGVLAWWPRTRPTGAALYDPVRWDKIAVWSTPPVARP